ncbi:hypothetical protein LSAT2_024103 [Lamellibrachia satsuma]|nr:hypothetical protein LSAT2_024103 [Lamellibrachia satsuma]
MQDLPSEPRRRTAVAAWCMPCQLRADVSGAALMSKLIVDVLTSENIPIVPEHPQATWVAAQSAGHAWQRVVNRFPASALSQFFPPEDRAKPLGCISRTSDVRNESDVND